MRSLRRFDIVVTTIFEPDWLDRLPREHPHAWARGGRYGSDHLRPQDAGLRVRGGCSRAREGFLDRLPDLDEQVRYLKRIGVPDDFIPWNTDNPPATSVTCGRGGRAPTCWSRSTTTTTAARRATSSPSTASSADPCGPSDGVKLAAGEEWFNICSLLHGSYRDEIYARGYPYSARHSRRSAQLSELSGPAADAIVAANAGLWLDDPDVDAISRLTTPRPLVDTADDTNVILDPGTWSPINTQNTALYRPAIPCYYYVRMGFPLRGMKIDRFGDIWSGYFLQACARAAGEAVRIGGPVADHHRQPTTCSSTSIRSWPGSC